MRLFTVLVSTVVSLSAFGAIKTQKVIYKDGAVELEGFLAYDDASQAKRPGVLVVHEWKGPNAYTETRARQLAELGYVAFAADIYGKDLRPKTPEEAGQAAGKFKSDRALFRKRVQLGLDQLKKEKFVDTAKLAAIGYCFGGTGVLELARTGVPISGVVSFHGGLDTPKPETSKIKTRILALHGAIDPNVPAEQVSAFEKEMTDTKADWQLVAYGGAVHGFTNPENGSDVKKGVAYNKKADERSWIAMKEFFSEIFR